MGITTKRGDKGKTDLLFGHEAYKTDALFDTAGAVDELGACIGIARASVVAPNMKQELLFLQQKLYVVGAEIATLEEDFRKLKNSISKKDLTFIEKEIETLEKYNDINNWFIPGEAVSSAYLELARTIARRLERHLWKIKHYNPHTTVYINRLSDYIWLLAQKEEYYLRGMERRSTEKSTLEQQTTI